MTARYFHEHPVLAIGGTSMLLVIVARAAWLIVRAARHRRCPFCGATHGPAPATTAERQRRHLEASLNELGRESDEYRRVWATFTGNTARDGEFRTDAPGAPSE